MSKGHHCLDILSAIMEPAGSLKETFLCQNLKLSFSYFIDKNVVSLKLLPIEPRLTNSSEHFVTN